MIVLQTKIRLPEQPKHPLEYGQHIISLGSCFSQHIGDYLHALGHRVCVNPFGALYNPCSIIATLERISHYNAFTPSELIQHDSLWHSSMHHGAFSAIEIDEVLRRIDEPYRIACDYLPKAHYLLLTWGSAWVYTDRSTGQVVANCHKRPEQAFERRLIQVDELVERTTPTLGRLLEMYPDLKIISTISPIRHLRDGAHGNQISKATLMLMDHRLGEMFGDRYYYFPAYELVMDELRDYRYYGDDLCHPAPITERIIRETFEQWIASTQAHTLGVQVQRLRTQWEHRPLHPDHPEWELRREQLELLIHSLLAQHPELDLSSWFS